MLINPVNMPCCTVTMFIYSPTLRCMIYKYIVIFLAELNLMSSRKPNAIIHVFTTYLTFILCVCTSLVLSI